MVNFMPSLVHFILKISTTGKVCKKSWESPGKKKKKKKKMKTAFLFDLCITSLFFGFESKVLKIPYK